jgi:hypothetical protein
MAQTHPNTRVNVCSLYVFSIDGTVVSEMLLPPTPQLVGTVIIAAYCKIIVSPPSPWSRIVLGKLLSQEMVHFYGTGSFITSIGLYPERNRSRPHRHTEFTQDVSSRVPSGLFSSCFPVNILFMSLLRFTFIAHFIPCLNTLIIFQEEYKS